MKNAKRLLVTVTALVLAVTAVFAGGVTVFAVDTPPATWEYQPLTDVKGQDAASGRVYPIDGNFNITAGGAFLIGSDAWCGMAVVSATQLPFGTSDSIAVNITVGDMNYESTAGHGQPLPYQGHSINISSDKPVESANGYSSKLFYNEGISVKLIKNASGRFDVYVARNGVTVGSAPLSGVTFAVADSVTFTFSVSGTDVIISYTLPASSPVQLATVSGAASALNGGVYLAFAADSYGGAYTSQMSVNTVNGTAVRDFTGFVRSADVAGLTPVNVDAVANSGSVTTASGALSFSYPADKWWPMAGAAVNQKVTLDGLSVTFKAKANTAPSENGYFGIFVSAAKPTAFSTELLTRTYAPNLSPSSTYGITFYGNDACLDVLTGGLYEDGLTFSFADESALGYCAVESSTSVLSFAAESAGVYTVSLNGTALFTGVDLSAVIDENGTVNLSFAGVGYGTSGGSATVLEINGAPANEFAAESDDTAVRKGTVIGAQIRTAGEQGIRFLADVKKDTDFTNITEYGFLMLPSDLLDNPSDLVISDDGLVRSSVVPGGAPYLRIVGAKLYHDYENSIQFTGVILGIPSNRLSRAITAVAYVQYGDGSICYTNALSRSVNYVEAMSSMDISNPTVDAGGVAVDGTDIENLAPMTGYSLAQTTFDSATGIPLSGVTAAVAESNRVSLAGSQLVLGSEARTIVINKQYWIKTNSVLTIPANVSLVFGAEGALLLADGSSGNLVINGPVVAAKDTVIFRSPSASARTVLGGSNTFAYPDWFGKIGSSYSDNTKAFADTLAATNGKVLLSTLNEYNVSSISFPGVMGTKNMVFIKSDVAGAEARINAISTGTLFSFSDTTGGDQSVILKDIRFAGSNRTGTAVNYVGAHNSYSRIDVIGCVFSNFGTGVTFSYSGGNTFADCLFSACNIGVDIGEYSMFLYFDSCVSSACNRFINCNVPDSGGVSNGIQIFNCTSRDTVEYDLYCKNNQAVYVNNCNFSGAATSIYLYACCDSRLRDNTIVAVKNGISLVSDSGRNSVINNNVTITSTGYAVSLSGSGRLADIISDNILNAGGTADNASTRMISVSGGSDIRVIGNTIYGVNVCPVSSNSSYSLVCQNNIVNGSYGKMQVSGSNTVFGNNTYNGTVI